MIGDVIEICGVKAVHVEGGYNGEGEYNVGLDGFQSLMQYLDKCDAEIGVGTKQYAGVLFYNGIPITDGDGNRG